MRIDGSLTPAAAVRGSRRRAMTLIEVMASISVLLIIGISAASILGKVTDIGARHGLSQQCRQSAHRLQGVLRQDVRLAEEVNLAGDDSLIELMSNDQVIRYSWSSASQDLIRELSRGDEPIQFDRFTLPPDCRPAVRQTGPIVTLELKQESQQNPWIIEAKRP